MSLAKHEIEKYYEQRYKANLRKDYYKYGIDRSYELEPKIIPVSDWPTLEDLIKENKKTLFNILVLTDKEQLDYNNVYYDLAHNWFYYYYLDKDNNRKYELIPTSKVIAVWPKDIAKYGGVISKEIEHNSNKADRDYYKLPRRNGRLDKTPLKGIFAF